MQAEGHRGRRIPEPGLGNGGLGHPGATFIDSRLPRCAGLRLRHQYKYGIFKQKFDENGKQVETPDYWLANEEPWGHTDYNRDQGLLRWQGRRKRRRHQDLGTGLVRARRAGGLHGFPATSPSV